MFQQKVQGLKAPLNCSNFILHMYGLILIVLAILKMLILCVYFFDSDSYMLNVSAEMQGLNAPIKCSDFIMHMYGLFCLNWLFLRC